MTVYLKELILWMIRKIIKLIWCYIYSDLLFTKNTLPLLPRNMVDNYSNVKLALISKYDTFVWPRHVRWLFYTNVDSNVQLKVTATAVIIRKRGWFSRIPFCVLLCAFYNNSDAFLMPMTSLLIPQQTKINPFYIILYLLA